MQQSWIPKVKCFRFHSRKMRYFYVGTHYSRYKVHQWKWQLSRSRKYRSLDVSQVYIFLLKVVLLSSLYSAVSRMIVAWRIQTVTEKEQRMNPGAWRSVSKRSVLNALTNGAIEAAERKNERRLGRVANRSNQLPFYFFAPLLLQWLLLWTWWLIFDHMQVTGTRIWKWVEKWFWVINISYQPKLRSRCKQSNIPLVVTIKLKYRRIKSTYNLEII